MTWMMTWMMTWKPCAINFKTIYISCLLAGSEMVVSTSVEQIKCLQCLNTFTSIMFVESTHNRLHTFYILALCTTSMCVCRVIYLGRPKPPVPGVVCLMCRMSLVS